VKVVIPMAEYKRFIQNQLEKVKSTASDLMSSRNEGSESFELDPHAYEELSKIALKQNTTVQALVNQIVSQHLTSVFAQAVQISVEKKEENPILYLDAICKIEE
jgi:predicted DNA-binding ribbon-helix-helix protein